MMLMRCAWQSYINLIPVWMRKKVDELGREELQELRLRLGSPPELSLKGKRIRLDKPVSTEDLKFSVNIASKYSPWSASSIAKGYITATGGHRVGICGEAVLCNGIMTGIRAVTSLNLRVARDFPGIAEEMRNISGSVLIIGKPGSGKTTLLRDLIRQRSDKNAGFVSVVDEREEIFPRNAEKICFPIGRHTDVLSGCPKTKGVEMLLRNMTPDTIAVDEITNREDCDALIQAGWCGVTILATAHAASRNDLINRPVYRPILDSGLFDTLVILHPDKSWHSERMNL